MTEYCNSCNELKRLELELPKAKELVFDCDGTLLDTMPMYYESWRLTCDELKLIFPIERFYAEAGAPVSDIFQRLIDEQKPKSSNNHKLTASYCESVKRRYHSQIEDGGMKAGMIDVVVDIARRYHGKIKMAVASSGWRDHVVEGLERNGILHLFDAVVTAEEVEKPKPFPDIFLLAAERIGVEPRDCVGFEDADLGMQGLERAGFAYACDVRNMYMYPRNVEKRLESA